LKKAEIAKPDKRRKYSDGQFLSKTTDPLQNTGEI
jgi:hypothetical protein